MCFPLTLLNQSNSITAYTVPLFNWFLVSILSFPKANLTFEPGSPVDTEESLSRMCVTGIAKTCDEPSRETEMTPPPAVTTSKDEEVFSFFDSTLLGTGPPPSASNHQFHGLDLGNHDNDGSGSGDDSYQGDMDEQEQGRFSSEDEVFGRFGVQETRHDS